MVGHLKRATALVRERSGADLREVGAVGISYQMHGLVIVGRDLEPLRPSIIWCDSRAVSLGDDAFCRLGEGACLGRLLNSPGNFTASRLAWVKENEPSLYARVHKMMLPGDYLAMKLTGEVATTPSGLSEMILWDFVGERTADIVLEKYGISPELLPDVRPTFSVQGELTSAAAEEYGLRTIELAYGLMRKAWHPDPERAPSFVLWNGSYGYDLASVGIAEMYRNLKESVAGLCRYEAEKGGELFVAVEPKPNEGHPAMLLPTVASAILFWKKLVEEHGIDPGRKGVNKEFGHSEMIGLDHLYDTVEEIDNRMLVHMHINSQGYNDGIILGGPGKFDIDHGARINGMNVAIAGLIRRAGYARWKGHDMQVRPYDDEERAIDRVVRSILSWEACEMAEEEMDAGLLLEHLARRDTAAAEDLVREAVIGAYRHFDRMYEG